MIDSHIWKEGLSWPESPRCRESELWLSDVHNFRVLSYSWPDAKLLRSIDVPGRPGGLGFLPDGRPIVAAALERRLYSLEEATPRLVGDLSAAPGLLNDMVVDQRGRVWVGATGFNRAAGESPRPGALYAMELGRAPTLMAEDLSFPNGLAITPDGTNLFVAETLAQRISVFHIQRDGKLGSRRIFAELDGQPDGLCLDAEGALWVALLRRPEYVRVSAAGKVIDRIHLSRFTAVSCVLGGPERRSLILGVCDLKEADGRVERRGAVLVAEVATPGAGVP